MSPFSCDGDPKTFLILPPSETFYVKASRLITLIRSPTTSSSMLRFDMICGDLRINITFNMVNTRVFSPIWVDMLMVDVNSAMMQATMIYL
ncbi:hypothetical protein IGI04_034888 [Brassica rapa subsp. trilocularis]|uniref:DUF4283 domain-containing protein n=1 Tax=Brassica rapa subsp. trilocularis TaxID=1813537 RepID=A0ABQ7LA20_BRACM|nr:hypothetical protein IGI04_034888 [Brassica rapa subsp. trilocularis]